MLGINNLPNRIIKDLFHALTYVVIQFQKSRIEEKSGKEKGGMGVGERFKNCMPLSYVPHSISLMHIQ